MILEFDESSKERLIKSLGFSINSKNEIEDDSGKILTNQDFEPITNDKFGGILKGSKIGIQKGKTGEFEKYFVKKLE